MGDCHYQDGNVKAERMFQMTSELVKILGIDLSRIRLEWVSSAEGGRFAQIATEFTQQVKALGPSALKQAA
jgi:F420-non-reducing hydrogenase iron-sulfur subunit